MVKKVIYIIIAIVLFILIQSNDITAFIFKFLFWLCGGWAVFLGILNVKL